MAEVDLNSLYIPPNYDASRDNFIGTRVGELVVQEFVGKNKNNAQYYKCKCTHGGIYCKGYTYATKSHLMAYLNNKKGGTSSCGCVQKEMHANGNFHKTHNLHGTRLYGIYSGMKARCYNPNRPAYKDYGARGIKICKEWLDREHGVENFYNWSLTNGYTDDKEINRIDENGDYCPSNCEWILRKDDISSKRSTHYETFYGLPLSLAQLALFSPLDYSTLKYRINHTDMTVTEAMNLPKFKNQKDMNRYIEEVGIHTQPFKFVDYFNPIFTSENYKQYLINQYIQQDKPTEEQMQKYLDNLPIAKDYWKKE